MNQMPCYYNAFLLRLWKYTVEKEQSKTIFKEYIENKWLQINPFCLITLLLPHFSSPLLLTTFSDFILNSVPFNP